MALLPPVPRGNPLIKSVKDLLVNFQWDNWFHKILDLFKITPSVAGSVDLTTQSASVGSTSLNMGTLSAGLYRVSYYQSISRAATVSSSLTAALGWTDGGVSKTFTGAAMTGNTTATYQGAMVPMRVDASTNVTYTLTYATSGATTMRYGFIAALETVPT